MDRKIYDPNSFVLKSPEALEDYRQRHRVLEVSGGYGTLFTRPDGRVLFYIPYEDGDEGIRHYGRIICFDVKACDRFYGRTQEYYDILELDYVFINDKGEEEVQRHDPEYRARHLND